MKRLLVSVFVLALGAGLAPEDAEAKGRLGGGRSLGSQRQLSQPQRQATPPTQQQAGAAPQAPASSRWFAPLAGLAAGLGLGWLFAHGGFGPVIGALLLALLAGTVAFALMRFLSRQRSSASGAQYAGYSNERMAALAPTQTTGSAGVAPNCPMRFGSSIPAGFDVHGFVREARRNFLRLQEANDLGDFARLREVTTEEMFEALRGDLAGRGDAQTDVVKLDAALLEVVTEGDFYWASVKFSGSIREEAGAAPEPFEEIWHLQKPVTGTSGWLLAGIQQPI